MAFNINDFKANGLRLGGARPNQFEVDIFFPFQSTNTNRFKFNCRAASIPPMIVDEAPAFYFGRAIKFAGDRTFPDWEITVYNDEDYSMRHLFEKWSNQINTLVSNRMDDSVFPVGYKVNAEVKHLGKAGDILNIYQFEGIWPKNIDAMPLDWSSTNQLQEFSVTLAYDLWRPASGRLIGQGTDAFSPTLADDGAST